MIIGIEASRANRLQKTGVEWYAYRIIQELKRLPGTDAHSWLLYGNEPLSMGLERGPSNWHERRLSWPPKYLWTQARLSWEMLRRPPDVLFVPAHVLPRIAPDKTVVTVHDVGFHRFPKLYKKRQIAIHEVTTREIVKHASRVIVPSEFSKQELVTLYIADASKIFVTPLGVDHERYVPADATLVKSVLDRMRITRPYIIFVGRLERKKNVLTALEAFRRYREERGADDPLSFVFAGIPGVGFDEFERVHQASGLGDKVRFTGYCSEEDKVALYSGAVALVHPAWYEGFGLTPLEAMACNCPVICARSGSLSEVVGDENALWFDPSDADMLKQQIIRIVDQVQLRQQLVEQGRAWVKKYTWQKTAALTFPLLSEW